MCGRYGFGYNKVNEIYERWEIEDRDLDYASRFNIAPSQDAPVIVRHSPNHLMVVQWGFMPKWMEGKKGARALINARSDGLKTSKTFLKPLQFSRCIVPATHFFEWKKTGENLGPYCIKLKDEEFFSMAGLLIDFEGEKRYVIITTEPNNLMVPIHNRMPAILKKEDEDRWLNPDETDVDVLSEMLVPFDEDKMEAYRVDKLVNSPSNDISQVIEKI